ncbi:chemotaxis-specific protein-glutamate methyltransferase CheB [Microcoleus sp. FACHB-68]|uniref:chemotaxis-specific protein-glutamate methyltransferase CheB n=1 Tax=Microcoleus sp. FACHB-68 TaxID=2692826 RepID=UPI001688A863|nr:chemotaxis-specific protein-glutamate methyltransferase CheB [Microcoleus sp. FACHB-68]MBD1936126.1 chemotaxis-specific protein-glutamate methyltransferase CheB [Microcoleus sp. FACHB-68]
MTIRVLLVEDSPVALTILKRMLASSPDITVVGTARTGKEGLALIPQLQPQVICTDLHMPQMDGLEFTQEVMANFPRPILVISSSVQPENTHTVFRLLQAGAVDVFPKPHGALGPNYESIRQELISKIRILSGVAVFTLRRRKTTAEPVSFNPQPKQLIAKDTKDRESKIPKQQTHAKQPPPVPPSLPQQSALSSQHSPPKKILAIGASTGGPQALHTILTQLPANFPVPVICVQHISEGFLKGLVDWLNGECSLSVRIATAGEYPSAGTIYFPPEQHHLELDNKGRFHCSSAPPVSGHRPSVTVTFNSVANFYGKSAASVLLTGMGRDGADGMLSISKAGGLTIAQDEKSCIVFGMPKEAIALGSAQYILPLTEIAPVLLNKILIKKI